MNTEVELGQAEDLFNETMTRWMRNEIPDEQALIADWNYVNLMLQLGKLDSKKRGLFERKKENLERLFGQDERIEA